MPKKYIVRLTDGERQTLGEVVAKFKGSSQKVRRAQVLLKADANGPSWTDAEIADAFGCRTKTARDRRSRLNACPWSNQEEGPDLLPPCAGLRATRVRRRPPIHEGARKKTSDPES